LLEVGLKETSVLFHWLLPNCKNTNLIS